MDELNMITGAVIAAGVLIHRKLGPGLLESVYEAGMATMKAGIRRIAN